MYRYDNLLTGKSVIYRYDTSGKMTNFIEYNTADMVNEFATGIYYNDNGKMSGLSYHVNYAATGGITAHLNNNYSYYYTTEGTLWYNNIRTDVTNGQINYTYDALNRLALKRYEFYLTADTDKRFTNDITYGYDNINDRTSGRVSAVISEVNGETSNVWRYVYDANGNITHIIGQDWTDIQQRYTYDDLGQLIREDNHALGYTYTYTYDDNGNIQSKMRFSYTLGAVGNANQSYQYQYDASWGDLLTDFGWDHIEYDEIGNPVRIGYYSNTTQEWYYWYELTWSGRQLVSYRYIEQMGEDMFYEGDLIRFTYDSDGIRTSKTVDGITYQYYLDGSRIVAETWNQNNRQYLLNYLYDESGSPIGLQYRTSDYAKDVYDTFFFERNLQGDIIAIYNMNGSKICTYRYDAFGTCAVLPASGITSLEREIAVSYNHFRYRGYYYDADVS